jgi:ABC-type dipeptide/oligopeptide/nickel transport system ATPase component
MKEHLWIPVMNVAHVPDHQQEDEGQSGAHALPEHLLQGTGSLAVTMPDPFRSPKGAPDAPLLEVRELRTWFDTDRGLFKAVDGISFDVGRGRTVGLVGESGCGKSVTSLSLMGLVPSAAGPGQRAMRSASRARRARPVAEERRMLRGGRMSMVFQEPMTSLNPVHTIGRQIVEAMRAHSGHVGAGGARARHRSAGAGAHPVGRAALRRLPAPSVGRHAPAGDDRHGAGLRTGAADRRRADHRARRDHPGADPRTAARPAAAPGHGDPDHHPRPRRDRRTGRRGDRDVRRPDRRERTGAMRCSTIRSIRTPSACSARSRAWTSSANGWPPSRARCPVRPTSRRAAASRRAARLPTRPATRRRRRCASWAPATRWPAGRRRSKRCRAAALPNTRRPSGERWHERRRMAGGEPVLSVRGLVKHFRSSAA